MSKVIKLYLQPSFLICVLVLAGAGIVVSRGFVKKEHLALKKSLDLLDREKLGHYKVADTTTIGNENIIESLGTNDYIQWLLEDESVPQNSPVRKCALFVTYYDHPDFVPHVPDDCYMGAGYKVEFSENITFECGPPPLSNKEVALSVGSDPVRKIPGRYLLFVGGATSMLGGNSNFSVLYLFNVNGEYCGTREATRAILNKNFLGKYSYFSKVEWKFFNNSMDKQVCPEKEEAIRASERLLSVLLPILERDHWPMDLKPSSSGQQPAGN